MAKLTRVTDWLVKVKSRLIGAVERLLEDKLSDMVSVKDFGAKGDGVTDDTQAFLAAYNAKKQTGGKIYIPEGTYIAYNIPLDSGIYWQGAGVGATTITQPNGNNKDIFVTRDFNTLTGVGYLKDAPIGFGIKDLTVDGNYLADYKSAAIGGDTVMNNEKGYGVKIFGSKYTIDIEIVNCAQVGFYSEAGDYTGYGDEQACHVNLRGRVFGKEAIVHRGPADIEFGQVFMGSAAWLPTLAQRRSNLVMSELFEGEPVHVMVTDETEGYHGHHEFETMHLYGNLSGYGYYAKGTGRLKGNHLICENCRGGFKSDTRTWGKISLLECHNNGRAPSALAGTLPKFYDIHNLSRQGFVIDAVVRRVSVESSEYTALRDEGRNSVVRMSYFVAGSDAEGATSGNMAELLSESSTFDINCVNTKDHAVLLEGKANKVNIVSKNHSGDKALIKRVAGSASGNLSNSIEITCNNASSIIHLDGLVTTERWDVSGLLKEGQTIFSSDSSVMDLYNRAVVTNLSVRIGSKSKSSRDVGRVNLENTAGQKSVTVEHNYFIKPSASQITLGCYDPDPTLQDKLKYLRVSNITDTDFTAVYELEQGEQPSGPIVMTWGIF